MYRIFGFINPYSVKNYEVYGPYILYFLILNFFRAPITTFRYSPITRTWCMCLEDVTLDGGVGLLRQGWTAELGFCSGAGWQRSGTGHPVLGRRKGMVLGENKKWGKMKNGRRL